LNKREPESLMEVMNQGAADIAQVVPEIRERLPMLPPPIFLEPEQARFRLFDSITTFLKKAGQTRPIVLILDDLHWADKPSLLLLEFLARELRDARLLVVGCYRNIEVGRQHPLAQTLGELARHGLSNRILLAGLTQENVAHFIEMTTGCEPSEKLVAAVHKDTEGNPFFVNEVVRLLASEGRLEPSEESASIGIRIPEGVREVIGRRLDHLSKDCNRILSIASVVGREFSIDILEPLCDFSCDRLLEVLEEAATTHVINEVPRLIGNYTFSHALIRETLYDELSIARRVRLHRRIGEISESLYGNNLEPHLAELAYHFFQAAPSGDIEKAIQYANKAAERATNLLAYEEAVAHYERALQALDLTEQMDEERRCELLLALGEAQTKAGDTAKARENFRLAADVAREFNGSVHLARAALGLGAGAVMGTRYGTVDDLQVSLLQEALSVLGEGDSALHIRLLAQLALALYYSQERRAQLSQEAVAMARRVNDRAALQAALYSRSIALEGFKAAEERLAVATEIIEIAEQLGNKEVALRGHYRRLRDLVELGDIAAIDKEIETYARLAEELRQPRYLWLAPFYKSTRAMIEGRFDECERLVKESLAIGQRTQDPNAVIFFHTQMVTLRGLQGRSDEVEPSVKGFVEKYPLITAWRATLAKIYYDMDRRSEVLTEFERLATSNFTDLPRDGAYVTALALLAQSCAFIGDCRRAVTLYDLLRPFGGHNIAIGSAAVFYGPVSRFLGLLAGTMSMWSEAVGHFEDALKMSARMGGRPFEAYTQVEYANMLVGRGHPGDREKSLTLLDQAFSTASELGMKKLVEDTLTLRSKA
jgi:tetratricopeptide (TPR) repeat protein